MLTTKQAKHAQMKAEAIADIIETLEDGFSGYYCDMHNEVFNTDYYIIGTAAAKKALEEYGVFEAIEVVEDYEKSNFGEVYTELHNPEKLVNMLYYIIGEEVVSEMYAIPEFNDNWNGCADHETNMAIVEAMKEMF